jgi:hypothetical protein
MNFFMSYPPDNGNRTHFQNVGFIERTGDNTQNLKEWEGFRSSEYCVKRTMCVRED